MWNIEEQGGIYITLYQQVRTWNTEGIAKLVSFPKKIIQLSIDNTGEPIMSQDNHTFLYQQLRVCNTDEDDNSYKNVQEAKFMCSILYI